MLICFLLPLLISWIFKSTKSKRIFLTYLFSGSTIFLLAAFSMFARSIRDPETDPALILLPVKTYISMLGGYSILLFMTLFFQYIFNKTMGLKSAARSNHNAS